MELVKITPEGLANWSKNNAADYAQAASVADEQKVMHGSYLIHSIFDLEPVSDQFKEKCKAAVKLYGEKQRMLESAAKACQAVTDFLNEKMRPEARCHDECETRA